MDLELRHLRVIRTIAEAGSLSRAATALGMTQPALSAQLKRLERSLRGELFIRGQHGVRPTELGELILDRARVLIPAFNELQEEARRFTQEHAARAGVRRFRLGGTHGPLIGGLLDRLATANSFAGARVSGETAEQLTVSTSEPADTTHIEAAGATARVVDHSLYELDSVKAVLDRSAERNTRRTSPPGTWTPSTTGSWWKPPAPRQPTPSSTGPACPATR